MAIFQCKTVVSSGAMRTCRIEAGSEAEAKSLLQNKGEVVIHAREIPADKVERAMAPAGKKANGDEVAISIRQLSILMRAGVPLVESLGSLAEQVKSLPLKESLERIAVLVSQGIGLSDAFARYPWVFPSLAVEMARVAEAGGNLAESMGKLALHMEKGAEIRRKVKAALAYPMVVVIISVVTVVALVTLILPRFMKMFSSMGAEIPWSTRMLMGLSGLVVGHWYIFLGATVALVLWFKRFLASPKGRATVDRLLLRLPIIGDVITKIVLSRVLASMSTLLSSGVPMVQTLEISASAADNQIVKASLLEAKQHLAEGEAVAQSLRSANVFPPLVIQMVASGEKTGELPQMLEHVCVLYDQETDAKVKSLTSIIEPILIVVLGLIVGFIAISVIVPVYSLVGGVK